MYSMHEKKKQCRPLAHFLNVKFVAQLLCKLEGFL